VQNFYYSDLYFFSIGTKLCYDEITHTEWLKVPNIFNHCSYDSTTFSTLVETKFSLLKSKQVIQYAVLVKIVT